MHSWHIVLAFNGADDSITVSVYGQTELFEGDLNILPLVTVALFLVTQKMAMTAPTNEQEAMQQKMMKYMTIFMGLLFYKVAAGLCLYFIVSSLWGIAERKLLPKTATADAAAAGGTSGFRSGGNRPRNGGSNGSAGPKNPPKAKRKK